MKLDCKGEGYQKIDEFILDQQKSDKVQEKS